MSDTPAYRSSVIVRRSSAFLGVLVLLALLVDGAVTLLDVAARASYTTNAAYKSVDRLAIDLDTGRVELARVPAGSKMTVRARVTGGLVSPTIERGLANGRLKLRGDCPGFLVISCGVRWTIGVPDGTAVSVTVGSGDVRVDGTQVSGTLKVRSGSGDVHVTGDDVPRLDAATGSGDVHVDLERAPRALRADTGSGDVDVEVPDVRYAIEASTGSGDVNVEPTNDPDSKRTIVVRADSGDVHVAARGR